MEIVKAGARKPPSKTVEEVPLRRKDDSVDDALLPVRIEVKHYGQISSVVPAHVWRCKPFKWNPITFATESEQLNSKFVEPTTQDRSLATFLKDPRTPMIYGVSGNPDDSKAKYFAAYLVAAHIKVLGSDANPVWAPMYGGFDNPYMSDDRAPPSMLIMTGLTPNSTNIKLEKARDLIEKFSDIPRIVVCAGMDPLSFITTRLFVPTHGLAYLSEALIKSRVEII
jgi:hypothetical protein